MYFRMTALKTFPATTNATTIYQKALFQKLSAIRVSKSDFNNLLGGKESNLHATVQSRVSYH